MWPWNLDIRRCHTQKILRSPGSAFCKSALDLIQTINDVPEYAGDPDEFVEGVEREGYQVTWAENRKHITFTCPYGIWCCDTSFHDEAFLKENLEALFFYRQMVGFRDEYSEPESGQTILNCYCNFWIRESRINDSFMRDSVLH